MKKMDSLDALFVHELKDLYSAEKQVAAGLKKMIRSASSDQLKQAFEEHLEQTQTQIERLETIFEQLEEKPGRQKCKGMEGLMEEGAEIMEEEAEPAVKDAALIAAAQKVEHYEISGYGTARTFAEMLGHTQAMELLSETLDEEKQTDQLLTELAMSGVNQEAGGDGVGS